MSETLTLPTIHLNGSSAARLRDGYEAAYNAIQAASELLRETAPNGRDYYPAGPAALEQATREHRRRQERLASVMAELDTLVGHCERHVR